MQSPPVQRARCIRFLVIVCVLLASLMGSANLYRVSAATLNVCPSGCTYTSIQAAINAAAPGDTIQVGAGTYNENLVIDRALNIRGAGAGIIAKNRAGSASVIKAVADGTPIVVRSGGTTIDGFTLDGSENTANWMVVTTGVEPYNYINIRILNNEFIGVPAALVGDVWTESTPGGIYMTLTTNLLIQGNFFNNLGKSAVTIYGQSVGTTYRNNDSYQCFQANFLMEDGPHYSLLMENNRAVEDSTMLWNLRDSTIRNNSYTGSGNWASHIYLGGGNTRVTVERNTFTQQPDTAIYAWNNNRDLTIAENTITADVSYLWDAYPMIDLSNAENVNTVRANVITFQGTFPETVKNAYGIMVRGNKLNSVNITNNEISGGSVGGSELPAQPVTSAVYLVSNDPQVEFGAMPVTGDIIVQGNKISASVNGITIYDVVNQQYGGLPIGKNVAFHQNDLTGNSGKAVANGDAPQVSATKNWWGDKYSVAAELTHGAVRTDPWLCSGVDTSPATGFQPNPAGCTNMPTRLSISTIYNARPNKTLQPVITVRAEDNEGNLGVNVNQEVTASISVGPAGAKLLGTTTRTLNEGAASFTDLSLDKYGQYRLAVTTVGLPSAISNLFILREDQYLPVILLRRP